METREIPSEHWVEFFDQFSRDHVNWPATIEVLDRQTGPQRIADNLPLTGISFDKAGTRPSSVVISAGDAPQSHITHVIDLPLHIRQANGTSGEIDLQFEPAQGPVTLIHLRGPIH